MDNFCDKCGSPTDEQGNCPKCSSAEAQVQEITPDQVAEVIYEPEKEPAYNTIDVGEPEAYSYAQPRKNIGQQPVYTPQAPHTPSTLGLTFKQVWNVIRCFFSKNTVDAISAQYNERLPIWGILLPLTVILSSVDMVINYNSSSSLTSPLISDSLLPGAAFSGFEIFLMSLIISCGFCFAHIFGTVLYLRAFKIKTSFKSCANLTMAAYLPLTVVSAFGIVTGGNTGELITLLSTLAGGGFTILLYIGINKAMNFRKPFWSFFLMLVCATAAAAVVGIIAVLPVMIPRVITSIGNTFSYYY